VKAPNRPITASTVKIVAAMIATPSDNQEAMRLFLAIQQSLIVNGSDSATDLSKETAHRKMKW
jgi:hypothetical protein